MGTGLVDKNPTNEVRFKKKVKREKVIDIIREFELRGYTGRLRLTLDFNQGGISSLHKETKEAIRL